VENEKKGNFRPDSVFSKKIRAGKRRTYFFDVKSTRANDYFLTITESKKRQDDTYERYKIFLYKEDFNKFIGTLTETIDHVKKELMPSFDFDAFNRPQESSTEQHNNVMPADEGTGNTSEPANTAREESEQLPPAPPANDEDLKW
jgi:hypothetical protein